jgi:beta-lactam-binding protein with PASTA domain
MSESARRLALVFVSAVLLMGWGCTAGSNLGYLVPDIKATRVPNVLGMSTAAAERTLSGLGLSAEPTAAAGSGYFVVGQSIAAGTTSTKGSTIGLSSVSIAAHGRSGSTGKLTWTREEHGIVVLRSGVASCLKCHLTPGKERGFCRRCHPTSRFDLFSEYPADAYR